jgi:serine/threonine-protein kinase ULK/ATG1
MSEITGYLLVRKLLSLIQWLKTSMQNKKAFAGMDNWEAFTRQKDYIDIKQYIEKEYEVFSVFYDSIYAKLKEKVKQFDPDIQECILNGQGTTDEKVLGRVLREYIKDAMGHLISEMNKQKNLENFRKQWIHVDRILDCLELDNVFQFENNGTTFNFRTYYANNDSLNNEQLLKKVEEKYKRLK